MQVDESQVYWSNRVCAQDDYGKNQGRLQKGHQVALPGRSDLCIWRNFFVEGWCEC